VGHFSDFEHKIKTSMNGDPGAGGWCYIWMLSNDLGDGYALNHNNKNHISVYFYIDNTYLAIKVKESYNGISYVDQYSVPKHNDWRYMKITKSGTDLKVRIYSDANYTTLLDTLSLTLHIQDNYRYLYGTNSYNDSGAQIIDVDIDNFDLGQEKTKLSSGGLSISKKSTKESSASLSVSAEGEKVSSGGLRIVTRFTKESSGGLSIYGGAMLESSGGLAISGKKTKESSAGLSISESKTKASSAGLRIIEQTLKASSASLTVKAAYTKESSAGMSIVAQQLKQSSASLTVFGKNTLSSSGGLTIFESVLKKGLFYGKLGDTILETVEPESFRISEEINRIPTYEFEVANSEANRTAIAANPTALFKIYWQHHGVDTHVFTGIINADGIEYISLSNIRITGFASYAKLGWPLFKHLDSEDAEPVNKVFEYNGTYTDYTTAANNATINDITVNFADVNHCLYIGEANPFWGLQVKYSTKGVPDGAVIVVEFSKGVGIWETLDVLDETNAFTEDPGTYDIIISHPPSDWARNTVDGVSKFWIRWRVVSGAYTVLPKLDQIHTVNVDVYRVFYLATSAREILLDVLEDTEYSMDTIDVCPEDEINLLAEYEYQWWIDEAKKVHIKQKRGTTYSDDITGDLTIFNNLVDYFNISNRLFGFSKRDGLSQIRAIIEDKASQVTHSLREIAVPKTEIGKYLTLKESLEKDIAFSKEPMQRLKGSVTTEFWGLRNYEVGDTVTLHQSEWVVDEGEFQIVKVDIGPILTQLNLGVSREHLEGLKSNMKRALDISNVQMHGSTTLFNAGPETMNYERKSDGSVFSAKLKIEIPSEVVKTYKVLLSWTIGKYRADVNDQTDPGDGHDHDGFGGLGGAIDSDYAGTGGAFTPDILGGGDFIPSMLSKAHSHYLYGTLYIQHASGIFYEIVNDWVQGLNHRHSGGGTGSPNSTADALIPPLYMGSQCTSGMCVTNVYASSFATSSHSHSTYSTGYSNPNAYVETLPRSYVKAINPTVLSEESADENPAHIHDGVYEPDHDHTGVYEGPHSDHIIPAEPAHNDHLIVIEPGSALDISFGIHEEAAGTVLELLINGEKIGEYEGAQTEIRIDGYITSGNNSVEIQPIESETNKKGSATIKASGILFIEPKRF
jgi:hypothetical protein